MKKLSFCKLLVLPVVSGLIFSSCATFRGMPSHGGGKRFDEEQRVVTAAIRHAAEKMDFSKLKGRKVAIEVTGLETSGTGQPFYPGLGKMSGYFEYYKEPQSFDYSTRNLNNNPSAGAGFVKDNEKFRRTGRWIPNFEFNPSLKSNNNITRQDVEYLRRTLEMRLRHDGFQIVPMGMADSYLVVLVDALGTNLSRKDYGVAYDDDLAATCEMTYYAIKPDTQNVIFASKAVASKGRYMERNIRFSPFRCNERSVKDFDGRIAPLTTKAPGGFSGGRSGKAPVYVNLRKQRVNELVQEAEVHLDANDRVKARKTINEIQKLDPSNPDLPELRLQLKEL